MFSVCVTEEYKSNPVNTLKKTPFIRTQSTKEIKEDIGVIKLNISNLHKALFSQTKSTEPLKTSLIYYILLIFQNRSLHKSFQ